MVSDGKLTVTTVRAQQNNFLYYIYPSYLLAFHKYPFLFNLKVIDDI